MTKKSTIQGSLGNYEIQLTEDGSPTLFSDYFQESCHSNAGAVEETLHNYILGTEVPQRLNKAPLCIFEVGFATGLGLELTLKHTFDSPFPLSFVSSELDHKLTEFTLKTLLERDIISGFELIQEKELSFFQGESKNHSQFTILLGDVRETLLQWQQHPKFTPFQAIYQDPFSPKRNPLLWTTEWFCDLKACSADDVILGTYSSTKAVWKAMIKAGWTVQEVKGFGQKRLSTRARLTGESSAQVLSLCERSPTPALSDASALKG